MILRLYEYRKNEGKREEFKHALVIEEAHHILSRRKEKAEGFETIMETSLRQIREFREAVIVIDQEPTKLSNSIKANTYCKITFNPNLADAWAHRGLIRAERQDYRGAVTDFDQALKLNPRLASTWANRGLVMLTEGRIDEAEQDFARCRELGGRLNPDAEKLLEELRERRKAKQ